MDVCLNMPDLCWLLDFNSVIQTEKPPEVKTLLPKTKTLHIYYVYIFGVHFHEHSTDRICYIDSMNVKNALGQKSEAEMLFV